MEEFLFLQTVVELKKNKTGACVSVRVGVCVFLHKNVNVCEIVC